MTFYGNKPLQLLIEQKGIILLKRLIQNIKKKGNTESSYFATGKGYLVSK